MSSTARTLAVLLVLLSLSSSVVSLRAQSPESPATPETTEGGKRREQAAVDLSDPAFLVAEAVAWTRDLRGRHRPASRPLTAAERFAFLEFFSSQLLDDVRVTAVPRLENPEFYERFREVGEPIPIDFGRMSALAVVDTVLVVESRFRGGSAPLQLLFHELVHVAQDREMGLEESVRRYVASWLEHGDHARIPHEIQAYELAQRFRAGGRAFSVEDEVRRLFGQVDKTALPR